MACARPYTRPAASLTVAVPCGVDPLPAHGNIDRGDRYRVSTPAPLSRSPGCVLTDHAPIGLAFVALRSYPCVHSRRCSRQRGHAHLSLAHLACLWLPFRDTSPRARVCMQQHLRRASHTGAQSGATSVAGRRLPMHGSRPQVEICSRRYVRERPSSNACHSNQSTEFRCGWRRRRWLREPWQFYGSYIGTDRADTRYAGMVYLLHRRFSQPHRRADFSLFGTFHAQCPLNAAGTRLSWTVLQRDLRRACHQVRR